MARKLEKFGKIIDGERLERPQACAFSGQKLAGQQDTISVQLSPTVFVRYKSRYAHQVTPEVIEGWRDEAPKPKRQQQKVKLVEES